MRHRSVLVKRNIVWAICVGVMLMLAGSVTAHAQAAFNGLDWLLDRGNFPPLNPNNNGAPRREGYNGFNLAGNDPLGGARLWIWPIPRDLNLAQVPGAPASSVVVDNPNPADPRQPRIEPQTVNAFSQFFGVAGAQWVIPPAADRTGQGYSITGAADQGYTNDYAYTPARNNTFGLTATQLGSLNQLPNVPPAVYASLHNALINDTTRASYTSGDLGEGRYGIEIRSPGDGTFITDSTNTRAAHANASQVLVRVSWVNTVVGSALNAAGINDPINSRLFLVNLSGAGWIPIVTGGLGPASFPKSANGNDQIVVTIYSLTPEVAPGDEPFHIITADAVRFIPQRQTGNANLGPINPIGRVLGPAVATDKFGGIANELFFYIAREESVPEAEISNPELRSWANPIDANSARAVDPTALATVPVFYCLDNRRGDTIINGREIYSYEKVRWRYVGATDRDTAGNVSLPTSTSSSASPLLANVRLRNGQTRTILYFVTTSANGGLGHIYAFDPEPNNDNPRVYWTYPSIRPLTQVEADAGNVPNQYHDPNYKNFVQGTYPAPTWGADQPVIPASTIFYYDGEIVPDTTNGNRLVLKSDVQVPEFGGMQASPMIVDDSQNAAGAQLLIVGNMNGRVYAFDAGGRGDFDPNFNPAVPTNITGTTQRIWTWPHVRADAYRAGNINSVQNPIVADDVSRVNFPSTPSFDPNGGASGRILIGSGDGHIYALSPLRDTVPTIVNGITAQWADRRAWMYPEASKSLGRAPSIATLFQHPTPGDGRRAAFFTAEGRVYSLDLNVPASVTTDPAIAPLNWVYPPTTDAALQAEFAGNAPVVLPGVLAYTQRPAQAAAHPALCYVVGGDGIIRALEAFTGNGLPSLVSQGSGSEAGATTCSPILTLITSNPNQDTLGELYNAVARPALIYSDNNGAIHGVGAEPLPDFQNTDSLLPYWKWEDADGSRTAAPILARGVIVQGTQSGFVYAYSQGAGAGGFDDTLGSGYIPGRRRRGAGLVSIDLRNFNVYAKSNWDRMMLSDTDALFTRRVTPGRKSDGTDFARPAGPLTNAGIGTAVIAEWGDYLYLAAWGVYKGLSTNKGEPVHGTAPPTIQVTFTMGGRGAPVTYRVTLPAQSVNATINPDNPEERWVDDTAIGDGTRGADEDNSLTIFAQVPESDPIGYKPYTGREELVYPWVAKARVQISPTQDKPYTPGLGTFSISAEATISQSYVEPGGSGREERSSNRYRLGQYDWVGMANSANPPASSTQNPIRPRDIYIANPIGVTVRGFRNGDNTGLVNNIGMGLINAPAGNYGAMTGSLGEILSNGNRTFNPTTLSNTSMKSVFAPVGMIQHGKSQLYLGSDGAGNNVPALFAVDRSNLLANTGKALRIRAATRPLIWSGGPSSVMNPLPWEQLPVDGLGTPDYPNIGAENFQITTETGQNPIEALASLKPPSYPTNDQRDRIVSPTRLDLQIAVPKYQPANVNWGIASVPASRFSAGRAFGGTYTDITNTPRGTLGNPILGPLNINTGVTTNEAARLYPAAGYTSEVVIVAVPSGDFVPRFNPTSAFTDYRTAGNPGLTSFDQPYRGIELGITVAPDIKMHVGEETLDIGKMPHGTGYSDPIDTLGNFRAPFAPTTSRPWLAKNQPSPWDNFFLPFTLYNDSNINLFDVRVEKLRGAANSTVSLASLSNFPPPGTAYSTRMVSPQVNNLTGFPLLATPYNFGAGGVGNIGIASSLDHGKVNYPNTGTLEVSLWPVPSPYVTAADIQRLGLDRIATNTLAETFVLWGAGLQGNPTLHKARVGDGQPTFMTVPDVPYGVNVLPNPQNPAQTIGLADARPKVSVAIPLGAASGTYAAPIYAYEDGVPHQWYTWLTQFQGATRNEVGREHDGILNVAGTPIEGFANPTFQLKATVTEARLTQGVTKGTLSQIDLMPDLGLIQRTPPLPPFVGTDANMLPTAVFIPGSGGNQGLFAYWTANRTGVVGNPAPNRPWSIWGSKLFAPGGQLLGPGIALPNDFQFALGGGNNAGEETTAKWWTNPTLILGNSNAATLAQLFPSQTINGIPGLPGIPTPTTERHASPQVALANNPSNALDPDAFLFVQSELDKVVGAGQQARQQTDSRTTYVRLENGVPQANGIKSFLNDPALTKLSPKPLYLKLNGQQYLYVFWHAGNAGQTALYYNVSTTPDNAQSWTADRKLPTPGALGWQSDPQPIYRRVRDRSGATVDAIDVVFTGVLQNRQQTELLLLRYYINPADGSLSGPALLPRAVQETLTADKRNAYVSRDTAWYLAQNESQPETDENIRIELLRRNPNGSLNLVAINQRPDGTWQRGQFDKASGLVTFDSRLGGQIVVDPRSGSVLFPNVPPAKGDTVIVSYSPQVMRLNTSRDESGIIRSGGFGIFNADEPVFMPKPALIPVGSAANPVAVWDKGLNGVNPRTLLTAPTVIRPAGASPALDRLWVVYRKTDLSGAVRSGLFYKSLRLMIRLPRPVRLLNPAPGNGSQQIANVTVTGNVGPYEVDWVRGRIYFTSIDEGSVVTVNYNAHDAGNSGALTYRVAWGDEISAATQRGVDITTPEVPVPTDTSVNEGQVSAFKDPYSDRLWMFWTSTRNSTTDLYYQTINPQFYPLTNNQR